MRDWRDKYESVSIKKDSYYDGIEELIEKGYLVQSREGSNLYTFYELPYTEKPNSDKQNNRHDQRIERKEVREMSKADKTKLLKANIEYYLVMSGYSKEQLATKLGISLASYYNKVKDINKFSYPEMVNCSPF